MKRIGKGTIKLMPCALLILLAGCATSPSQPIIDVQKALVPVQVKCVSDMPTPPNLHTDAEIKAMNDYDATIALLKDRVEQKIYQLRLETVVSGCL